MTPLDKTQKPFHMKLLENVYFYSISTFVRCQMLCHIANLADNEGLKNWITSSKILHVSKASFSMQMHQNIICISFIMTSFIRSHFGNNVTIRKWEEMCSWYFIGYKWIHSKFAKVLIRYMICLIYENKVPTKIALCNIQLISQVKQFINE